MLDLSAEIKLQTTRSGGAGGQNVNKVETAVQASFAVAASALLTEEQKAVVLQKLRNRISGEGVLQVKAQTHRTQIQNKEEAVRKINILVTEALHQQKRRIGTRPTKAAKEARLHKKKQSAFVKMGRRKLRPGDLF